MERDYDVIVIGAGIGGLTAASILASEGLKTAVLELDDRVGGRALSLRGSEVCGNGADWYRDKLGRHYCYLADSGPAVEEMVSGRLLDGYVLDLGYHGVPCAGKGYLGRLADYLGVEVRINPCDTGFFHQGEYYSEPPPGVGRLDDRLYRRCKEKGIRYWSFYEESLGLSPEELDRLEEVSLYDYCERLGLTGDDVVWQSYRCLGTLFTTINNPHDISAGEIIRYAKEIMAPVIMSGEELHVGGFVRGGIGRWPEAVAAEFERSGGELFLDSPAREVLFDGGEVRGVRASLGRAEEVDLGAAVVVSGLPVQDTFQLVPPERLDPDFVSRSRSLYGYGSVTPYFGLKELPVPPDQAARLIKTPVVVEADGDYDYDVYMCWNVQSAVDPDCAPRGKHLLSAYLPLTERESLDSRKVGRVVERVPEFLEGLYPGFSECVEWSVFPVCWKLEGVAKSISQAGNLKPAVKAPGARGLYFAGDTARGFGVAMDCACSAGINCASAVLGRPLGIE